MTVTKEEFKSRLMEAFEEAKKTDPDIEVVPDQMLDMMYKGFIEDHPDGNPEFRYNFGSWAVGPKNS